MRKLGAAEVNGSALGYSAVVSAGGSTAGGQQPSERGHDFHRHLKLSVCLVSRNCFIAHLLLSLQSLVCTKPSDNVLIRFNNSLMPYNMLYLNVKFGYISIFYFNIQSAI